MIEIGNAIRDSNLSIEDVAALRAVLDGASVGTVDELVEATVPGAASLIGRAKKTGAGWLPVLAFMVSSISMAAGIGSYVLNRDRTEETSPPTVNVTINVKRTSELTDEHLADLARAYAVELEAVRRREMDRAAKKRQGAPRDQ